MPISSPPGAGSQLVKLADVSVAAAAASISISGLTDYPFYLVHAHLISSASTLFYMGLNADGGNNYNYQYLKGEDAVLTAVQFNNQPQIPICNERNNPDQQLVRMVISAISGKNRYIAADGGGNNSTFKSSGYWASTNAITSLQINAGGGNVAIGSRIVVWGCPP